MRVILQRVTSANVKVDAKTVGKIDKGLLILLGVNKDDTAEDIRYLIEKVSNLRIFNDENGKMNLSVKAISGSALVVSQFTLYADTRKGRRPGFSKAAAPDFANEMYENFCNELANEIPIEKGIFGANMKVSLLNDGPVTIIIDSEERLIPRK